MKMFVVAYTVLLTIFNVNKLDGQETLSPNVLNIIVILDTSDRVSREKHPRQIERDIEIVKVIVAQFERVVRKHIGQSEELAYEDSLNVIIPDQPAVPSIPWEIVDTLKIEDPGDCESVREIHDNLAQQEKTLLDGMPKLYEFVQQHSQTGSDIWDWFRSEAEDYFDEDKRNLIICLSDGYLNFDKDIEIRRIDGSYMRINKLRDDPNWKQKLLNGAGLSPCEKDFSAYNVKFLMVEIAPQSEKGSGIPYQQDFDIIKTYWDTWLNSMGIKDTDFIKQGRPVLRKIRSLI